MKLPTEQQKAELLAASELTSEVGTDAYLRGMNDALALVEKLNNSSASVELTGELYGVMPPVFPALSLFSGGTLRPRASAPKGGVVRLCTNCSAPLTSPSGIEVCVACGRTNYWRFPDERRNVLDFDDYQKACLRTAASDKPRDLHLAVFALGLVGEAAEVSEGVKKIVGHSHPEDPEKMKSELGDVLFYLAVPARDFGFTLSEVAQGNVDKLLRRYPNGLTSEDSIRRIDVRA